MEIYNEPLDIKLKTLLELLFNEEEEGKINQLVINKINDMVDEYIESKTIINLAFSSAALYTFIERSNDELNKASDKLLRFMISNNFNTDLFLNKTHKEFWLENNFYKIDDDVVYLHGEIDDWSPVGDYLVDFVEDNNIFQDMGIFSYTSCYIICLFLELHINKISSHSLNCYFTAYFNHVWYEEVWNWVSSATDKNEPIDEIIIERYNDTLKANNPFKVLNLCDKLLRKPDCKNEQLMSLYKDLIVDVAGVMNKFCISLLYGKLIHGHYYHEDFNVFKCMSNTSEYNPYEFVQTAANYVTTFLSYMFKLSHYKR